MSNPVDASGASLLARLQSDQAAARRDQLKDRVMLLGMIIAEVRNREIEVRREVTDDDVVDVIRKGIKKRRESVALYAKAGRTDLQEREECRRQGFERPEVPAHLTRQKLVGRLSVHRSS